MTDAPERRSEASSPRGRLTAMATSSIGRRSAWSAFGLVGSSVATAVTVFVLARQFGTATYGVYAGIGAIVTLVAIFGALGTREVLIQRVTRDRAELPAAWGVLLAANVTVGIPLLTVTIGLAALLLPDRDLTAIALIAVAEYVSIGLVRAPAATWVALDRFPLVSATNIFDAVLRLVAASSLLVWEPTIRTLAAAQVVVMVIGAAVVNAAVWRTAGPPRLVVAELVDSCRKGASYSIASVSTAVQSNIDQFMLVRARLDVDAGLYALGVRFIGYSMLPLHAVTSATVPEIFRRGHGGIEPAVVYARRLVRVMAAISVAGAVVAIAVSGPLGRFLGDRFDGVVAVVAALAGFPLIRSMQNLATTVLMGSGHQRVVARIAVATAVLNVLINLPLIAWYGWWGAAIATYVSELVSLAALAVATRRLRESAPTVPGPGIAMTV